MFRVVDPGPLLLLEDAGRPGILRLGVSASGFADPVSARLANRLVGNDENAAILESLFGGVRLNNIGADTWIAITGVEADVRVTSSDGTRSAHWCNMPVPVPASAQLSIGHSRAGVRACIAFRGGVDSPTTLGSSSRDTLAELGPEPLTAGDLVRLSTQTDPHAAWVDSAAVAPPPRIGRPLQIRIMLGPRDDMLTPRGISVLLGQDWEVTTRGNRVGIRLSGPEPLRFESHGPLPSEGSVRGAIEVPADGFPFVLMSDHPVTVGYPVVGVVAEEAGMAMVAQARPGTAIKFHL
jgi:biotin-dependent carboxylase-like uncharacterized protein